MPTQCSAQSQPGSSDRAAAGAAHAQERQELGASSGSGNGASSQPQGDAENGSRSSSSGGGLQEEAGAGEASVSGRPPAVAPARPRRIGGPAAPLVDEYARIVGSAALWTWQLAAEALRWPLQPRSARLMDMRLAAHMDPGNADKCAALCCVTQ